MEFNPVPDGSRTLMSDPRRSPSFECHDLNRVDDPRDLVYRAVAALAQGESVVFSLGSVQGIAASGLHPDTVRKLIAAFPLKDEPDCLTVLLKGAEELADWVPGLSRVGSRLASRLWPGATTLVFPVAAAGSLLDCLSDKVHSALRHENAFGFRLPPEPFVRDVLRLVSGPVLLRSFTETDTADETRFEANLSDAGVKMVMETSDTDDSDGRSVVRVQGETWSLISTGGLDERALTRLAGTIILFVCTGNTCRSPMAEALCKVLIAERLKCSIAELESRGYVVFSAGIAAIGGMPAAAHAIDVVQARGGSLKEHSSKKLNHELLAHADQIFVMTGDHLDALLEHAPEVSSRTRLLHPEGHDVADPVGADRETYLRSARAIESYLIRVLDELGI